MIMKPKAKKFRIRRSETATSAGSNDVPSVTEAADDDSLPVVTDDGFGSEKYPTAAGGAAATAPDAAEDSEIEAIRREGLTGRQLRTARRVASRNGIAVTSDFDAIRQLRKAGIDPFQRANMLELVVSEKQNMPATTGPGNLPQTVTPPGVPSTEVRAEENRMRDIMRIQQDLVRRRRRRTLLLVARLAFFVLLPSFLAGYYYYVIATPFYNATAAFVINQSNGASASALGGLFSGTQFATSQDAITVQNYLQSRDAMLRLDKDQGFKKVFSAPNIDPLQRLATPATNEAAYKIYTRNVNVGYDPTEGIIRLDVTSPDPNQSVIFAKAMISYAEQQVDSMTKRMRDDQMKGAQQSYNDAEAKLEAANRAVVALQTKYKVMSSDVEVSLISSQIGALQTELTKDTLDLAAMKSTSNPVQARIDPLQQRVDEVNRQIAALRAQMTQNDGHGESLAEIQGQLLAAQADVQTRQLMLSTTLQALESARITANQQTRYLSVGVQPVAADDPSFPRAFEDTIVAFLIFAGLYLILSMTASILKEQVSS